MAAKHRTDMGKACEYCGCKLVRNPKSHSSNKRRYCSHRCAYSARVKSTIEKIKSQVVIDPNTGCWNWRRRYKNGYGTIQIRGKPFLTHRLNYQLNFGPIGDEIELHHLCENKACCNPAHLEPLSHIQHSYTHLKTHCKRGHPFDEKNTHFTKIGRRCRECHKMEERKRREGIIA